MHRCSWCGGQNVATHFVVDGKLVAKQPAHLCTAQVKCQSAMCGRVTYKLAPAPPPPRRELEEVA